VLDGPRVSGSLPEELRDFPVIDRRLRDQLFRKYYFRAAHPVTVGFATQPGAGARLAREVGEMDRRLRAGKELAGDIARDYRRFAIDPSSDRAFEAEQLTEPSCLVKDVFNSFVARLGAETARPSFIDPYLGGEATDIGLGSIVSDLIAGRRRLPIDEEISIHIAFDVSYSMKSRARIPHGLVAMNRLSRRLPLVMPATRVRGYHFSSISRRVDLPTERVSVPAEGTKQALAFRTVLGAMEPGRRNVLILITDGEPEDLAESLRAAEKARAAELDYTQILLHTDSDLAHEVHARPGEFAVRDRMIADDRISEDRIIKLSAEAVQDRREKRFRDFTRIAETAGGNQVVLTEFAALGLVGVELYDRYVGLLSLSR
jgi:hypothetical protein